MSKQTIITRLELHNFKGVTNRVVDFHRDQPTIISGRNASGKTTIMDAFTWLLWGTNAEDQGTASFDIKPNDANGKPQLNLDTEVVGTIEITDTDTGEHQTITLKRRWVSQWRTRKGEVEREFVRNKGEYFIDDVPVKESEYKEAVAGIIPPEVFKTITNPYHFARLPWQTKRQTLLSLIPGITNQDIAAGVPEFEQLLRDLNGKTLEDHAKVIGAAINKINAELENIPVRIQEVQHNAPEAPDFNALAAEKTELEDQLDSIEAMMAIGDEAVRLRASRSAEINREIEKLRQQQNEILNAAQQKAWEAARHQNQRRIELQTNLQEARFAYQCERHSIEAEFDQLTQRLRCADEMIASCTAEQTTLRKQWETENAKVYSQDPVLKCPLTGRACADHSACYEHAANFAEASVRFIAEQEAKKTEITRKGKALGQEIEKTEQEKERLLVLHAAAKEKLAQLATTPEEITKMEQELTDTPEVAPTQINSVDIPEYVELQKRIETLPGTLSEIKIPETAYDEIDLRARKAATANRLDEVKRQLGLKEIIESQQRRIAELQTAEKNLLQERAGLQKKQAISDRFIKARMTELEKRVNTLFTSVRFQMFEPTATTNDEKPTCVCWIGEAKYSDKNKAGKVNAGLDIINTFCRHYQITAPIFIDNAESVNEFIPTESQLVLLQVSTDNLTIQ